MPSILRHGSSKFVYSAEGMTGTSSRDQLGFRV